MLRKLWLIGLLVTAVCAWSADPAWHARLTYIEACSCDLFCVCYFNDHAAHQGTGAHKCNFNNVVRVDTGKYGDVALTGLKVWLSGDLGADWATKGRGGPLVVTFEPSATQKQKDGIMAIFSKLYPVQWQSVNFDTAPITWSITANGKTAEAALGNGKGEVKLVRFAGPNGDKPSQIHNVRYFAATWNSPFDLYHSSHYYKGHGLDYRLKRANGFVITVEMTSDGKRVTGGRAAKKSAD